MHGLDAFVDGPEVDGVVPQELPHAACTLDVPPAGVPVRAAPRSLSRFVHESRRPSIPAGDGLSPGARDARGRPRTGHVPRKATPAADARAADSAAARAVQTRLKSASAIAWLQHRR